MTVVRRQDVQRSCAICHRTLLLGERADPAPPGLAGPRDPAAQAFRRRSADISDVTAAHREATAAIDGVLVALVSSYRSA
mgnify:CR=1 FL=1